MASISKLCRQIDMLGSAREESEVLPLRISHVAKQSCCTPLQRFVQDCAFKLELQRGHCHGSDSSRLPAGCR